MKEEAKIPGEVAANTPETNDRPFVITAPDWTGGGLCEACNVNTAVYVDIRENETEPNRTKVCRECACLNDMAFAAKKKTTAINQARLKR